MDQRKIGAVRKVALVTGSTSGIGRSAAKGFGRAGWSVVVHSRDEFGGEETVAEVESLGGTAGFVPAASSGSRLLRGPRRVRRRL